MSSITLLRIPAEIDIEVHVVIDNVRPEFTTPQASGTVPERARDEEIATFSASDINNQVLNYSIEANVDEETGVDTGAAGILPSLVIGTYDGVLKTKKAGEGPADQPDYDEPSVDDPDTDADESARETDNEHVFTIIVSDGTSSTPHEFTLTVTDVDEPVRGEALNFKVDETRPAEWTTPSRYV